MEDKKFYLHIGCHRGTLISRDTANPRPFDTYEEAAEHIKGYKDYLKNKGGLK